MSEQLGLVASIVGIMAAAGGLFTYVVGLQIRAEIASLKSHFESRYVKREELEACREHHDRLLQERELQRKSA